MKTGYKTSLMLLIGVTLSCSNEKYKEPETPCLISEKISYSESIQPIFNRSCALGGCHVTGSAQGNLNLEANISYTQLMRQGRGYIDTANPRSGVLYSSLVSVSNPMPPSGRLPDCELKLIENWMKQGAKNN